MISLTISANGTIQAFCEPYGPDDRGYYLELPEGSDDFRRVLYQALARRQCRFNERNPLEAVDPGKVLEWLRDHPPAPVQAKTGPKAPKPTATLSDLKDLFK